MAVVMMGGDEKSNPIFHDFLGMTSDDDANKGGGEMEAEEVSIALSPSERLAMNNSEVVHCHDKKNVLSGPEASDTFSGRKRSYVTMARDKMLSVGSDSPEKSRLMKRFGKEAVVERVSKLRDDDEIPYSMQLPPRPTSSLLLHPAVSARPDSLTLKWERSLPINPGSSGYSSSRFGQSGAYLEKRAPSYPYKDVNLGATPIPQTAADEGSRTGVKGSGILNIINSSSIGAGERTSTGPLPYSNRSQAPQIVEAESSNVASRYNLASSTRQMTIFYAGQAHVFDDVHPNKADVIMALAGSSGVSWTTNCSPKPSVSTLVADPKPRSAENELQIRDIISIPDRELVAQVARMPLTNDLQSIASGGNQGIKALMNSAVEPETPGKKDA